MSYPVVANGPLTQIADHVTQIAKSLNFDLPADIADWEYSDKLEVYYYAPAKICFATVKQDAIGNINELAILASSHPEINAFSAKADAKPTDIADMIFHKVPHELIIASINNELRDDQKLQIDQLMSTNHQWYNDKLVEDLKAKDFNDFNVGWYALI